ncbi:DsbA family protein [Niastella caeni]|uniref:DsbA family protein n=1 Tax=Niastella caeni TaxID=2569763 RepID=UPI001FB6FA4D|nr:DsbA family protein [Niastella caeni]
MEKTINQACNTSAGRQGKDEDLNIVYFTDPLCCWSWAMNRQLAQLKTAWNGTIHWRYCMGGLLPAWNKYIDSLNCISRPAQMGPVWMQASQISGLPIPHKIWVDNPPASSYPACIAVKCAMLQSPALGELYFHYVQEAIMVHSLNIAQYEVLQQVAEQVAAAMASFDLVRFYDDMKNGNGLEAFRKDIQEVKYRSIQRFPALLIQRAGQQSILITGYKPADLLISIIKNPG